MRMKIRVEGTADIARKVKAMGRALTRKTLKPILRENLQPIAEDMRSGAAIGTGEMAKSVRVSDRLSKTQRSKLDRIAPIEMYVGPGPLPQVIQEEFGNLHQLPRPFIRPAFDRGADKAIDGIATQGLDAILDAARKG